MTPVKEKQLVTLYIHSKSSLSFGAVKVMRRIASGTSFKANYRLVIIEIDKNPELAEQNKILATPLLIIKTKYREKKILGNLLDISGLRRELSITGDDNE